jgi:hypothetical protein
MSSADTWVFKTEKDIDDWITQLSCGNIGFPLPCELTIAPYVPKRSTLANRYYWEILTQAADQTGHTKEELHLFMRHKFLGADNKLIFEQSFNMLPSTADLNVKDFSNYVRSVETFILESGFTIKAPPYYNDIWASENGFILPAPNFREEALR